MNYTEGGVCAPRGFRAAGVYCGVKKSAVALDDQANGVTTHKKDLALICSEIPCSAAGIFTKNQVKAAPVLLDMEQLKSGRAQAIAANSKNANACAPEGMENARRMAAAAAAALGIAQELVLVSSTGVIGQRLNVEAIEMGLPQAAAELAATESSRREFLASVAHELRTPLAILQGQLENMLSGVEKPEPEKLFSMQEEVMRLTRLVAELRDLSLAQVNQLELHRQPVQVNELLERAAAMIQPLLEEKRLTIEKDLAPDVPVLQLDPDRLNQVVYNLLNNAIRYTKTGTLITVGTALEGGSVVITIADQGPGIAQADLPHIFEQFYRSDKARARASGSSGIGLALAKSFVENQGGTLSAENRSEGGAKFVIRFPLSVPQASDSPCCAIRKLILPSEKLP